MSIDREEEGEGLAEKVVFKLKDEQMWREFNAIGNEMIITKNGRCLFPLLRFQVQLLPNASLGEEEMRVGYKVYVTMQPVDTFKWKFVSGRWRSTGHLSIGSGISEVKVPAIGSPMTLGELLSKDEVSFSKVKLTNNPKKSNERNQILLFSFRHYCPVVILENIKTNSIDGWPIREAQFIAVTHYQNPKICELKKNFNPHAKGFLTQQISSEPSEGDNDRNNIPGYENIILDGKDYAAVYLLNSLKMKLSKICGE